ncbi:hypothetical protein BO70DRAFT_226889 [Aspergillus heteromorphus CBS 117.55]|uniref:Uncharacterized protein n=1 Tax=Aspergillus heteromorphus CBS 117.55 TaxID=1448321 RepID=A0A317WFM9_9EURO|nr:uncharacterized protein BO70DRAFT_226889 [Aspergillus heteromorphus CBS 117.55]PWY84755.1 hypothetical protein BO70DRAFT_226889 [Aspergillus heteromorphus CBS 117.55]
MLIVEAHSRAAPETLQVDGTLQTIATGYAPNKPGASTSVLPTEMGLRWTISGRGSRQTTAYPTSHRHLSVGETIMMMCIYLGLYRTSVSRATGRMPHIDDAHARRVSIASLVGRESPDRDIPRAQPTCPPFRF